MLVTWLDDSCATGLVETLGQRLSSRTNSVFAVIGDEACREHLGATLCVLREDLETGKHEALRVAIGALIEDLTPRGLSFSDLRFYVEVLRSSVLEAAEGAGVREPLEAWFFEFVMVFTMQFVVHRDELMAQQAARREVQHLESQLRELQIALTEKTKLLEQIRQTSTPVIPVVKGILVVPLIGIFDTLRAELLTERLLNEVAHTKARSVILDISGVPMLDAGGAQLILSLVRVVRLLGAELILVGMAPATARTIVDLELDLTGLRALSTLQEGLALALRSRRLKIAPL